LTHMLIAVTAMFLQQTCGSIAQALPEVLAPLIIAELHADAAWVGIYFSLTAFAGLIGQLGSGGFIMSSGSASRLAHLIPQRELTPPPRDAAARQPRCPTQCLAGSDGKPEMP
jgi:hypothetical protein